MRVRRQTLDEILEQLSPVEAAWMDEHAERGIALIKSFPQRETYLLSHVAEALLDKDFDAGLTAVRLFLDLSKDDFTAQLWDSGAAGIGIKAYRSDRAGFLRTLEGLGVVEAIAEAVGRPTSWSDVLVERLKSGRGSAIKGQKRGRSLEDFTEVIVKAVFGPGNYDKRCSFVGENGVSTEKADFAIAKKEDPRILIESKAYGATGSKQSDVIGDVTRIVAEKRHDTVLLLVTDGQTWKARESDLRKLIELQNRGRLARIYTVKMADELERDLRQLKAEQRLVAKKSRPLSEYLSPEPSPFVAEPAEHGGAAKRVRRFVLPSPPDRKALPPPPDRKPRK